jgi:hypothetical protein
MILDWHSWPAGEAPGFNDPTSKSSIGSLCKHSENTGEGDWCKECIKNKKYSWIDYKYNGTCPGEKLGWHKQLKKQ